MGKLLWKPSEEQIKNSNIYRFMGIVNEKYQQKFDDFAPLMNGQLKTLRNFGQPCGTLPISLHQNHTSG